MLEGPELSTKLETYLERQVISPKQKATLHQRSQEFLECFRFRAQDSGCGVWFQAVLSGL